MISETNSTKLDKKKKIGYFVFFVVEYPWNNPIVKKHHFLIKLGQKVFECREFGSDFNFN